MAGMMAGSSVLKVLAQESCWHHANNPHQHRQHRHTSAPPSAQALPLNKAALAGAWKPAPLAVAALTVPQEVHLRSDARAARRAEFDGAMAAKQAQLEAERAALLAQEEAQEEEEGRALRRRLGHKALPLPGRL